MTFFRKLLFAATASFALAGAAQASDLYTAVPAAPGWAPEPDVSGFEGFYLGIQKGWWFTHGYGGIDGVAGVNFVLGDNFLVGAEVMGGALTDFSGDWAFEAYLRGRAGVLLDDELLLYKVGEIGLVDGNAAWGIGGGLEFMASDNMSIRGEVRGGGQWGDPFSYGIASIGFIWHVN